MIQQQVTCSLFLSPHAESCRSQKPLLQPDIQTRSSNHPRKTRTSCCFNPGSQHRRAKKHNPRPETLPVTQKPGAWQHEDLHFHLSAALGVLWCQLHLHFCEAWKVGGVALGVLKRFMKRLDYKATARVPRIEVNRPELQER